MKIYYNCNIIMNSSDTDIDMNIDVDVDEYIETHDINKDICLDDLIDKFKNISFFGNDIKFTELLEFSKLRNDDYDTNEIQEILDMTFERYKCYLKEMGNINENIEHNIRDFLIKFQDYNNMSDDYLFKYMNYIDNNIIKRIKKMNSI